MGDPPHQGEPITDPETISPRATVLGGKRLADDFEVIWRGLPIGRIMKSSGVPSRADQWWWGFTFYGAPSVSGGSDTGTDLEDCKTKLKIA